MENPFKKKAEKNQRERIYEVYEKLNTILKHAPLIGDCSMEENDMYAAVFDLRDRIMIAGYSKKEN